MAVLDDVRLLGDEIEARATETEAALYGEHPLQRCWRDLHAAGSHLYFSDGRSTRTGQILLGQPTDDWPL